ncbi:MAG: sigma-70 family RNA polymerase sigma factor [Pseudomonadota bacterium]
MTPAERDAQILSLERQVKYLAGRKHALLPYARIHLDEMISAAWLGAIRAVDSFDEAQGHKLSTYASWKIASAMADYLRDLDPLTRNHRIAVTRGAAAPVFTLSAETHGDEPGPLRRIPDDRAACAQHALDARITLEAIEARARLQPRSLNIVRRWAEGNLMREIGAEFGLAESRVSQICTRAIEQLRTAA